MMRAARGAVAAGVTPGDRIGVWAPNTARWLITAFGCSAAGAVIAPMNTRYKCSSHLRWGEVSPPAIRSMRSR